MENNKTLIFETEAFRFLLEVETKEEKDAKATCARIVREDRKSGERLVLMDYTWPKQLIPEIHLKAPGVLEDGELHFTLSLAVHHVTGMVQGEFTEEEDYIVLSPEGTKEELVCSVVDIRRKTRFAIAERHLTHLPHRTYPPTDGAQGPYGHPKVNSLPPIPKKKRETAEKS